VHVSDKKGEIMSKFKKSESVSPISKKMPKLKLFIENENVNVMAYPK
jgi:hypothetical protein